MQKVPTTEIATPSKSTPLYQQLYIPTLGGPNPKLLNLDKFVKKYSKISKFLLSLNLCIGFFLAISIGVKVYYISEYFVHVCKVFEHFIIITLIGNLVWLFSSFLIVFGNKKKSSLIIRIYLVSLIFCLIIFGFSYLFWKMNSEKCSFHSNMSISLISNGLEIFMIVVLFFAELYLLKLLKKIHVLRESYTNDNITDLK